MPFSNFRSSIATVALAIAAAAGTARAQTSPPPDSCSGQIIKTISISPGRPPFAGSASKWRAFAHALGLHHATTRSDVIRTYLLFKEGDACNDARVSESMRVLRDLPFIANATAGIVPDSSGGVDVNIQTTDEVPVLVAGGLRGGVPSALTLGNADVGGLGLRVVAGGEYDKLYRSSAHVEVQDAAPFDEPVTARVYAARDRFGGHVDIDLSHLFLSNFQRGAWHASFRNGDDYPLILRPFGDDEAVEVHEQQWSVSTLIRSTIKGTVLLAGPVALGTRLRPTSRGLIVSDSGALVAGDTALLNRFTSLESVRAGGMLGARHVDFTPRAGLDALFAPQDVMTGWQVGGIAAPGRVAGGNGDLLVATSLYGGMAPGRTVMLGDVEAEARRDFALGKWQSTIANARGEAYFTPSSRVTFDVIDNFSVLGHARLPLQLSLGDAVGGVRGFYGSNIVGARRNVVRSELRVATPKAVHNADLGVALFADAGTMWAGDVPFGMNASRQAVGFSIVAAYPTRTKHLYRLDFAFPLQRDVTGHNGNAPRIEIRFTSGDPTANLTQEPYDVTQARLAPVPSSLFAWPAR